MIDMMMMMITIIKMMMMMMIMVIALMDIIMMMMMLMIMMMIMIGDVQRVVIRLTSLFKNKLKQILLLRVNLRISYVLSVYYYYIIKLWRR